MRKLHLKYLLLFSFVLLSCAKKETVLKVQFAGDVILDRGVADEIRLHQDSILVNSISRINKADFFVINLEGTFIDSGISEKDRFNFSAPENWAGMLKKAAISHASLANNHSRDYGINGYDQTIKTLETNEIKALDARTNPTILKKNDLSCAIFTANFTNSNEERSFEYLLESIQLFHTKDSVTPVVLFVHWGLEYQPAPLKSQRYYAELLVDAGVSAIIGHHPHLIQSIEFIKDVPVFYSIGNFVADAYLPQTTTGLLPCLTISESNTQIGIQCVDLKSYFPSLLKKDDELKMIIQLLINSSNTCFYTKNDEHILCSSKMSSLPEINTSYYFGSSQFIARLKTKNQSKNLLSIIENKVSNSIQLEGKISQLEIADINNDGKKDILLTIKKKVQFDPNKNKRINIFSYENGNLQSLWLGTQMMFELHQFETIVQDHETLLKTIESDSTGQFYNCIYYWEEFGFALKQLTKINNHETS